MPTKRKGSMKKASGKKAKRSARKGSRKGAHGYIAYALKNRQRADVRDLPFGTRAKKLAAEWNSMTPAQKAAYA